MSVAVPRCGEPGPLRVAQGMDADALDTGSLGDALEAAQSRGRDIQAHY